MYREFVVAARRAIRAIRRFSMHKADIARLLLSVTGLGTLAATLSSSQAIHSQIGDRGYAILITLGAVGTFASTLVNTLFSPAQSAVPSPPNLLPSQTNTQTPPKES